MTPSGHGPSLSQVGGMAAGGGEPLTAHLPIPSTSGQGWGECPRCNSAYSWAFLLVFLRALGASFKGTWSGKAGNLWRVSWAPWDIPGS